MSSHVSITVGPNVKGGTNTKSAQKPKVDRRAQLAQIGGKNRRFRFIYSPLEMSLERDAISYAEVERPGRKPLLEAKGYQLRQVSFETVLIDRRQPTEMDILADIATIRGMANEDNDLRFTYDGTVRNFTWRISDLTIDVVRRNKHNRPTVAKVSITLTETSRILNKIVPGMSRIVITAQPISGNNNGKNSPSSGTINGPNPPDPDYTEDHEPSKDK